MLNSKIDSLLLPLSYGGKHLSLRPRNKKDGIFSLWNTLVTNLIFHLSYFLSSLKITVFISLFFHTRCFWHCCSSSWAVCRTRVTTNLVNVTYAHHESPSSSVVRASDRYTGGHGFDSRWRLRFWVSVPPSFLKMLFIVVETIAQLLVCLTIWSLWCGSRRFETSWSTSSE